MDKRISKLVLQLKRARQNLTVAQAEHDAALKVNFYAANKLHGADAAVIKAKHDLFDAIGGQNVA